jgi:hypothetical protein
MEGNMHQFKSIILVATLFGLVGCSSGIQVIQKPLKTDRMAIVMFEDCNKDQDCPGSGKKISDIYGKTLGAPVLMFESDAKNYDIILSGKIMSYNEAVPMAFNANIVSVDFKLSRITDSSIIVTQKKTKTGSNITSSAKGLTEDLADDLKLAIQ